jgi:hypothetical protein
MDKIKLIVATHKEYEFPKDDIYIPIHVGKGIKNNDFGVIGDDTGDNISIKNQNFCELTALYWAWKNELFKDVEYCGLVHYRRYFDGNDINLKDKRIASQNELLIKLKNCDVLVPKKRNYFIEDIKTHYSNAHYKKDLEEIRNILDEKYPEYLNDFDVFMEQTKIHLFNMFVMKSKDYYKYCEWLFDVLFELEKRIDISNYDSYQARVFGFLSERLFNVWLIHNKLNVKEIKVINIEGENLILKAIGLLKRKFIENKR